MLNVDIPALLANPTEVDAVVFDCDGLLADTAPHWHRAFSAAAVHVGITLTPRRLRDLHGSSSNTAASYLVTQADRPELADELAAVLQDALRTAIRVHPPAALPGAQQLAGWVSARRPTGVASNSPADILNDTLAAIGLLEILPHRLSAGARLQPKPAPDLYLALCARLGVRPARTVAFEDSHTGAQAAYAAGLHIVAVTEDTWPTASALSVRAYLHSLSEVSLAEPHDKPAEPHDKPAEPHDKPAEPHDKAAGGHDEPARDLPAAPR